MIKARVDGPLTGIRGVSYGEAKHHKAGAKNSFGFSELVDRRTALILSHGQHLSIAALFLNWWSL
jgi:hypothetical protein